MSTSFIYYFLSAEDNTNNDLDSLAEEDEVLPFNPDEATDPVEVWNLGHSRSYKCLHTIAIYIL